MAGQVEEAPDILMQQPLVRCDKQQVRFAGISSPLAEEDFAGGNPRVPVEASDKHQATVSFTSMLSALATMGSWARTTPWA